MTICISLRGYLRDMRTYKDVQRLKDFVIDHGLPKSDMALLGIKCPYCGKSDRIRKLEAPADLPERFDPDGLKTYAELWRNLALSNMSPGVCKFCHNLLEIVQGRGEAKTLCE